MGAGLLAKALLHLLGYSSLRVHEFFLHKQLLTGFSQWPGHSSRRWAAGGNAVVSVVEAKKSKLAGQKCIEVLGHCDQSDPSLVACLPHWPCYGR